MRVGSSMKSYIVPKQWVHNGRNTEKMFVRFANFTVEKVDLLENIASGIFR